MKKTPYIISAIVIVAISRFLPHPPNFAPMGAIALFSAFAFDRNIFRYLWPLLLAVFTDVVLVSTVNAQYSSLSSHFTSIGTYIIYASYLAIGFFGSRFSSKINTSKVSTIAGLSVGSALFFFLSSNFAVWLGGFYGYNLTGLISCYTAALPFLGNSIGGELFFNAVLFGGYFYVSSKEHSTINA